MNQLGRMETFVFSTRLSVERRISAIMAVNLMGAIVGGLLEYNSMYLGFQALYLMAMVCYVLAFASEWVFSDKGRQTTAVSS